MFNIKNLFKKKTKDRKNKLIENLSPKNDFEIDLNEEFIEQPATIKAQFQKAHFSILEFIENTKTTLAPNEIFVIEILDETISVGIIIKKAFFLDIKYLKKYTYQELHQRYQKIVNKEVEYDRQWYENIENIVTILSYDIVYTLPQKVVVVDNRYSDFIKVTTKTGRFKDKKLLDNLIKKEFELASGYKEDDVYLQVTQRPLKETKDKNIFIVSMAEKEYFDKINQYFTDSDLIIKRYHSIKSSLYSSFFVKDKNSAMRIHVEDNIAYTMEKHKESGFEYQQFNLEIDFTGIELVAYTMDEVIISGSGKYYEEVKNLFVKSNIKVRTFSYIKDMNRAIIRLEEGVKLDTSFATVVGVAYHELFKINFSSIRLGVSKNMTIYEIMYNNLKVLPFVILFLTIIATYGTYGYLEYKYDKLSQQNKGTTILVNKKKNLTKTKARQERNIKNIKAKIKKIENIFNNKTISPDAIILHQIAQKLPNDMIITKIEKKTKKNRFKKDEEVVVVTGKCYQEKSLLKYIKDLKIPKKKVFLVKLKDSKKLIFEEDTDKKSNSILSQLVRGFSPAQNMQAITQNMQGQMDTIVKSLEKQNIAQQEIANNTNSDTTPKIDEKLKEIQKMNLEDKKIYFSDTLNNEFQLEIK